MKPSYVRTKINNLIDVTEIVTIHYYEFDDRFVFKGEKHNFWEIVYVDSGAVEIVQDGASTILKQGEILFHEPNEFHAIKSYKSAPNIVILSFVCKSPAMAYFKKFSAPLASNLKPFLSSMLAEAERTYLLPKNDIHLKRLLPRDAAPIGSEQLIKTYLEQFLILLIRSGSEKHEISIFPSREVLETQLVLDIKAYLTAHLEDTLKIADICNHFGYSKTYLSQVFKAQCSVSLMQYYTNKKIEYAKKLIRENRYSFSQISDRLSFDNPQYFSRVFRRVTGLSPSEFMHSLKVKP